MKATFLPQLQREVANDACIHQEWHRGHLRRRKSRKGGGHKIWETQQSLIWAGLPYGKDSIPRSLLWNALLMLAALTQIPCPLSEFSCGVADPVYIYKHHRTAQLLDTYKISDELLRTPRIMQGRRCGGCGRGGCGRWRGVDSPSSIQLGYTIHQALF